MRWVLFSAAALMLLLSACSEKKAPEPFEPKPPESIDSGPPPAPGSVYSVGYDNLFADDKAYRLGDVITILVSENMSGSGSADTKSSRDSALGLEIASPTLMGKVTPTDTPILGIKEKNSANFQGKGDTSRNAKLVATMSARVIKVYPNGNVYVSGTKKVKINNDQQTLTIAGIARPTDIAQDNSIFSSQLSDMYVEYNGEGFMADSQEPGWLTKFLLKVWPF